MATHLIVLIATAGRPDLLERTLHSLQACPKPDSYGETVVVENGPLHGAKTVVEKFQSTLGARWLHVSEPNKSHALNVALASLPEALVYFTDDDVRFAPNTLCAYHQASVSHREQHFFGGPIGVDYEAVPPAWLKQYMPVSARGWSMEGGEQPVAKAQFLGFNWAAFTRDLRKAGPFSTHLGPGSHTGSVGQDTDMQSRLLQIGVRGIYLPDALVWHYVPKERCSPEWVLHRAYRHGIRHGIEEFDPRWSFLFGFPRWTHRELGRRWWQVWREALRGNGEQRFWSRHALSFFRGFRHGARVARRMSALPSAR